VWLVGGGLASEAEPMKPSFHAFMGEAGLKAVRMRATDHWIAM